MNCDFIENMVRYAKEKKIMPTIDGYYMLVTGEGIVIDNADKIKARKNKILINPTREECIKYMPRQTYKCDHMFDKVEDGYVVVEKDDVFWAEHEQKYQEWLKTHENSSINTTS